MASPLFIELEPEAPTRSGAWRVRACGALVVVVLAAGVVSLALVAPRHTPTPAERLAGITKYVREARTAHFVTSDTWISGRPKGQLGSHYEESSRGEGVLSLPDSAQWTDDHGAGDGAEETIVTPEAFFFRDADSRAALAGEQWVEERRTPGGVVAPSAPPGSGLSGTAGDALRSLGAPSSIAEQLTHLTNVTQLRPGVLRGTLDLRALPGVTEEDGPIPDVTVELTGADDGRLDKMLITATGPDPDQSDATATGRSEVTFDSWGSPVQITAPAPDAIDKTPNIDEKGLAAFTAAPILTPGNLAPTYQLTDAFADNGDPENGDCPQVALTFADPALLPKAPPPDSADTSSSPDLEVTVTPVSCDSSAMDGGQALTVAGSPAHIQHGNVKDGDYAVTLEVVVGATRVTVESDLPDAVVLSAFRRIVPFNLSAQHIYAGPRPWEADVISQ
jgi:hypothetical protein